MKCIICNGDAKKGTNLCRNAKCISAYSRYQHRMNRKVNQINAHVFSNRPKQYVDGLYQRKNVSLTPNFWGE